MTKKKVTDKKGGAALFNKLSKIVTKAAGSPLATIISISTVIVWAILGPVFGFSDTWQLVINTGTTIITFLMVFVIQQSQNRDSLAVQLKLNELIASSDKASNRLVDVEDLTEGELEILKKFYVKLAQEVKSAKTLHDSHSMDDAEENHRNKMKAQKK